MILPTAIAAFTGIIISTAIVSRRQISSVYSGVLPKWRERDGHEGLLNLVLKHDGYQLLRLPFLFALSASGLLSLFNIFRSNLNDSARTNSIFRQN